MAGVRLSVRCRYRIETSEYIIIQSISYNIEQELWFVGVEYTDENSNAVTPNGAPNTGSGRQN